MHWYIKKNGVAQRYVQLKKDGTPSKRVLKKKALEDGACLGFSDQIEVLDSASWRKAYFGNLGIKAGQLGATEWQAKEIFEAMSNEAAEGGTKIHEAIENYLGTGTLPEEESVKQACLSAERAVKDLTGADPSSGMSEVCFLTEDGEYKLAGTPDWTNNSWLLDFKGVMSDRAPRWKECAQLAVYRRGLFLEGRCKEDASCANIYIRQSDGSLYGITLWSGDQLDKGLMLFYLACDANKLIGEI